jgi:hypothetical protein
MTKNNKRAVRLAYEARIIYGDVGLAARSISAAIRSATTNKSQAELLQVAHELCLINHPDFII